MDIDFSECPTGRKMEVNMAKLIKDIDYLKTEQVETKTDLKTIIKKIDGFDDRYAKRNELDELRGKFNWAVATIITVLISGIGLLLKLILNV